MKNRSSPARERDRNPAGGRHGPTALAASAARRGARRQVGRPPWDRGAEAETGTFGAWLRRQREMREISLRDIAERTKISLRYLEAMEEDRFDLLPAPVFAKGFLREYARYVGLSPGRGRQPLPRGAPAGRQRGGASQEPERRATPPPAGPWAPRPASSCCYRRPSLSAAWLYLGAGGAAARPRAGPAGGRTGSASPPRPQGAAARADRQPPARVPAVAARPDPPPPPSAGRAARAHPRLHRATAGSRRLSTAGPGLRAAGARASRCRSTPSESVVLKLGNAGAVEAQVNGYPLALPGGGGRGVRDLKIDLETVRALREKKEAG